MHYRMVESNPVLGALRLLAPPKPSQRLPMGVRLAHTNVASPSAECVGPVIEIVAYLFMASSCLMIALGLESV